jgi:hypothetical protein
MCSASNCTFDRGDTKVIIEDFSASEMLARDARQESIFAWCLEVFAPVDSTPRVRMLRFVEEAAELAQAQGLTQAEVETVVAYVFARPVGSVPQEVGGVMVTLQAFCAAEGISLVDFERIEIERINSKPIEHFQKRQQEKSEAGLL